MRHSVPLSKIKLALNRLFDIKNYSGGGDGESKRPWFVWESGYIFCKK